MPVLKSELVSKLLWVNGSGLGICSVGFSLGWDAQRPSPKNPDWPSIVAIEGHHRKYKKEEIEKIVAFAEKITAQYDRVFGYRMGANLVIFGKQDGRWLRKRMTWNQGPMYSSTLDEALAFMSQVEGLNTAAT